MSGDGLRTAVIPGAEGEVHVLAFAKDASVGAAVLEEGVTVVRAKAFSHCENLRTVRLPSTLTGIDMKAFEECGALEQVIYNGNRLQWERVEISPQGSKELRGARLVCLREEPDAAAFSDVDAGSAAGEAIRWLYAREYTAASFPPERYGAEEPFKTGELLEILRKSGRTPALRRMSARRLGELLGAKEEDGTLCPEELETLLQRYLRFLRLPEKEYRETCREDAVRPEPGERRALTRAQGAVRLADFLQSGETAQGREKRMMRRIRELLERGGDGRMHIAAVDLCVEGVLPKPGDMVFLIFPKGTTMLIDTGYVLNESKAMGFLRESGLKRLDYLVFSHGDSDHIANGTEIARYFWEETGGGIGTFLWTGQENKGKFWPEFDAYLRTKPTQRITNLRAGERMEFDGVQMEIFGPTEEEMRMGIETAELRNSQSLVMRFRYGESSFLTSGDLYTAQEKVTANRWGEALRSDILKTDHHGCFTSNCPEWLDTVGPRILFTCSNDNGSMALADEAERRGIESLTIGCDGMILISMGENRDYEITTAR